MKPGMWICVLALLAGCGTSSVGRENDRLRRQVRELEREMAVLDDRNRELSTELAAASTAPGSLPEDIRANTPHVARIAIGGLGHVRESPEGGTHTLVVYVQPTDGLDRFVQLVGRLSVNAAVLPEGEPARTVGAVTLDPAALRAAYRTGFFGTHYTIEVPLAPTGEATACDVRVYYTDGRTGESLEAAGSVPLVRK